MSKHIVSSFSYSVEAQEIIKIAKKTAEREDLTLSKLIVELLEDYVKKHGDGNPIYKLDKWTDNPEFLACPALMSSTETIQKWILIQAQRKNWDDLNDIKYKLQEWINALRKVGIKVI